MLHFIGFKDERSYRAAVRGYMWQFFSRWEGKAPDGADLFSNPVDESKKRVYGMVFTEDQVRRHFARGEFGFTQILLDNMRCNKWPTVVKCQQGVIPYEPERMETIDANERPAA